MTIQVVLYSKPGCHLCEIVKCKLERLRQDHPFNFCERNIVDDPDDYERFHLDIPVVFINDEEAFKHTLDGSEFLERLAQSEKSKKPNAT